MKYQAEEGYELTQNNWGQTIEVPSTTRKELEEVRERNRKDEELFESLPQEKKDTLNEFAGESYKAAKAELLLDEKISRALQG